MKIGGPGRPHFITLCSNSNLLMTVLNRKYNKTEFFNNLDSTLTDTLNERIIILYNYINYLINTNDTNECRVSNKQMFFYEERDNCPW